MLSSHTMVNWRLAHTMMLRTVQNTMMLGLILLSRCKGFPSCNCTIAKWNKETCTSATAAADKEIWHQQPVAHLLLGGALFVSIWHCRMRLLDRCGVLVVYHDTTCSWYLTGKPGEGGLRHGWIQSGSLKSRLNSSVAKHGFSIDAAVFMYGTNIRHDKSIR